MIKASRKEEKTDNDSEPHYSVNQEKKRAKGNSKPR